MLFYPADTYPENMYLEKLYYHDVHETAQGADLLFIKCVGITLKNSAYVSPTKRLLFNLFEYILDGEGYIVYDGTRYHVKKGDFIIARNKNYMNKEISYGSSKEDPYLKLWFTANGSFIEGMLAAFNVTEPITIINCPGLRVFQEFIMSFHNNEYDTLTAITHIASIMYSAFRKPHTSVPDTIGFDELVDAYLEQNIQHHTTIDEAAATLGVSARNFTKYFKKRFNTTYGKYMQEQRMQYAKILLRNEKYSVLEISTHLGFCDQSYFSKCFYKKYGMYPSEFRKQLKKLLSEGE